MPGLCLSGRGLCLCRDRGHEVRRFFVGKIKPEAGLCSLTGAEARHIARVLKMTPGDHIILMDEKGIRFQAVIETVSYKKVVVSLERLLPPPTPPPVKIFLCQALPRSRSMDYIVQKASELGAHKILPFYSERSVVSLNHERGARKMEHWCKIAVNSAKQCDGMSPVMIQSPINLQELTQMFKGEDALKVVLWEEERVRDLKGLLRASSPGEKFVGVVGPEGGFSFKEIERVRGAGFIPVSLGNRVMRSETAAIVMTAIVQYEWGDL